MKDVEAARKTTTFVSMASSHIAKPKSSLIISTYNWPVALELVLMSVARQRVLPDEVIIADDGSTDATMDLISSMKISFPVPLHHVWHEDDGFRVSAIRNKAVCRAQYEYIIQVDGDMILHPSFVADHLNLAEEGCYHIGSRVLLSEEKTKEIHRTKQIDFNFLSNGIKNRVNAVRLPFLTSSLSSPSLDAHAIVHEIRGCNMSYWRNDFVEINGYNENFVGWGREDSEVGVRLVNHGIQKKRIKFSAIQYHQHHDMRSRDRLEINDTIMEKTIAEKITYCERGMADHCA